MSANVRFAPLVSNRDEARDTAPEPATATRLHRLGIPLWVKSGYDARQS